MKPGDKIDFNEEEAIIVHATPKIDEQCNHDWVEDPNTGEPQYCKKCNLSFMRYVFSCCT